MRNAFILVVTSLLFLIGTGIAQEIPLTPEMKEWESVIGKWTMDMETRATPSGAWRTGSQIWDYRSEGYFVEIRGTSNVGGRDTSWIEVVGYDPVKRMCISSYFTSNGGRGSVTSMGWSGTTLSVNYNRYTADREVRVRRNTFEYSPDFKSVTLTGETFTDGKWWISAKGEGTKVE